MSKRKFRPVLVNCEPLVLPGTMGVHAVIEPLLTKSPPTSAGTFGNPMDPPTAGTVGQGPFNILLPATNPPEHSPLTPPIGRHATLV